MSNSYCTHIDLIRYGNTARLVSQLAGNDYGVIPTAEQVLGYFVEGVSAPDTIDNLRAIKNRVQQAISNAANEINGLLALCASAGISVSLPTETLATANMDMALVRLFESLADDSTIKLNANRWTVLFDKIATGKLPVSSNKTPTPAVSAPAETVADELVFTEDTLNGY